MLEFEIPFQRELRVVKNGSVFKASRYGRDAIGSCSIDVVNANAERGEHKSTIHSVNPGYIEKIERVVVLNGLKITFSGWGRSHWVYFELAPE